VAKASTRGWDRVFVIVLENHSQHAVIGDLNTPFITALAQQYG
jgi:hypothetical protein